MPIRTRAPRSWIICSFALLIAQAVALAAPNAAQVAGGNPFDHLADELGNGVAFVPLAATAASWSRVGSEVIVSFGRFPLAPGETTAPEYSPRPGMLLYAEDTALTLVSREGDSLTFGPGEQIVVPEMAPSNDGQPPYTVTNTSRACGTLMQLSFGQLGDASGGYFTPAWEGQGPVLSSGDQRCAGDPESLTMFGPIPSQSTYAFMGRLTWQGDYFSGNQDDPMRDRFAPHGPVALIVESGRLIVADTEFEFEAQLTDGWIEAEMPVSVFGGETAERTGTDALLVGLVAADEELLAPTP